MEKSFQDRKCPKCGSTNLAHSVQWITGPIPAGIEGEIFCRNCLYWETLLSAQPAQTYLT
jgi:predicted nucleic-acid-binding Zn-ribbon protein